MPTKDIYLLKGSAKIDLHETDESFFKSTKLIIGTLQGSLSVEMLFESADPQEVFLKNLKEMLFDSMSSKDENFSGGIQLELWSGSMRGTAFSPNVLVERLECPLPIPEDARFLSC